jgi:nitrite reductase/ring-hydroxylating ferredoxin subunit
LKLIGTVERAQLADGAFVRLKYPPYDVLVTLVEGVPYAIEDACNHAGASLAEGFREGDCGEQVGCPMHGYLFDLRSGALVRPRGLCSDQRTFATRENGDVVEVYEMANVVIF